MDSEYIGVPGILNSAYLSCPEISFMSAGFVIIGFFVWVYLLVLRYEKTGLKRFKNDRVYVIINVYWWYVLRL